MANFADRIAYWYMRLNGFFMVENFVHHETIERRGADADILAIRLPHARESIGSREVPCDDWRTRFRFGLEERPLAVIVQVKGGGGDTRAAFSEDRLRDAARRFGAFDDGACDLIAKSTQPDVLVNDWRVAKLVVGIHAVDHVHFLALEDAWAFMRQRFQLFQDRKRGDWDHLPDTLVQLLAWRISEGATQI
jgi:hypothetical protein